MRDHAVMIVVTVVYAAPIAYMFIGSLKPSNKVLNGLGGFVPTDLSFDNYTGVVGRFDDDASGHFWRFYLTSAIVSFVVVVGGLIVNSMAGYALARLRWKGRNVALLGVIVLVIVPFEAIAVPLYFMLQDFRNTYFVQFIPFVASAFSVYLFYSFFAGMPKQLEESARIDG
ncbi:MAG: carbohydrate ABC transporter permease, partial [Microthrixaceae bacterium]|nr:carbohydrate ABC transporter permease [Microthrixaceae bacterium]